MKVGRANLGDGEPPPAGERERWMGSGALETARGRSAGVRCDGSADSSNVPGVALYFYMLSAIRHELTLVPYFARTGGSGEGKRSALAQLSSTGNLVAGAVARTSVGFVLNPITVIKARFEVSARSSRTQWARMIELARSNLAGCS